MIVGTVKYWNDAKGFGFITSTNGGDIFVHISEIADERIKLLVRGQRVEFEQGTNTRPGKICAKNVEVLDD
jgi:cold shock protein